MVDSTQFLRQFYLSVVGCVACENTDELIKTKMHATELYVFRRSRLYGKSVFGVLRGRGGVEAFYTTVFRIREIKCSSRFLRPVVMFLSKPWRTLPSLLHKTVTVCVTKYRNVDHANQRNIPFLQDSFSLLQEKSQITRNEGSPFV